MNLLQTILAIFYISTFYFFTGILFEKVYSVTFANKGSRIYKVCFFISFIAFYIFLLFCTFKP
jgi:hypothetical protein